MVRQEPKGPVKAWCIQHFGAELEITAQKDFLWKGIWDDFAIKIIPGTGMAVTQMIGMNNC
jgi:hypothetical protein